MHEPITYELATIQDIFDKVPTDCIRSCMAELGILLSQAAGTHDLFMAVAEDMGADPAGVISKLPEFFSWIDDSKGELSLRVRAQTSAKEESQVVFSIDTQVPKDPA